RFQISVNGITFGHDGPHFFMAHQYHIQNPHIFVGELILSQLAQANARIQRDIARGWLEVPPDDLHECRFARTVSANQAITVAFAELDTDVLEEGLGAELDGEVGSGDHLVWNSRKKWVKPFILPALVNGVR